jgi:hypothetical protein
MPKVNDNRRELYDLGMNDVEIAHAVGTSKAAIFQWRTCRKLSVKRSSTPALRAMRAKAKLTAVARSGWIVSPNDIRFSLYLQDYSDGEIGAATEQPSKVIADWRYYHGLPLRIGHRATNQELDRRMALYRAGKNDVEIGNEEGCSASTVMFWRNTRRLLEIPKPRPEPKPRIKRIAKPPQRRFVPQMRTDPLLEEIKRALGWWLATDVRDDAASELLLAVGEVAAADIRSKVRVFSNRAVAQYSSKFGPRSIDVVLPRTEELRLVDVIRDDRSRDWLEEMGATVC